MPPPPHGLFREAHGKCTRTNGFPGRPMYRNIASRCWEIALPPGSNIQWGAWRSHNIRVPVDLIPSICCAILTPQRALTTQCRCWGSLSRQFLHHHVVILVPCVGRVCQHSPSNSRYGKSFNLLLISRYPRM